MKLLFKNLVVQTRDSPHPPSRLFLYVEYTFIILFLYCSFSSRLEQNDFLRLFFNNSLLCTQSGARAILFSFNCYIRVTGIFGIQLCFFAWWIDSVNSRVCGRGSSLTISFLKALEAILRFKHQSIAKYTFLRPPYSAFQQLGKNIMTIYDTRRQYIVCNFSLLSYIKPFSEKHIIISCIFITVQTLRLFRFTVVLKSLKGIIEPKINKLHLCAKNYQQYSRRVAKMYRHVWNFA